MELVLIEWVDSHGPIEGWKVIEENTPEPLICESVGWLLHDGKNCKKILPHRAGFKNDSIIQQGRGEMTIPVRSILKITKLKY